MKFRSKLALIICSRGPSWIRIRIAVIGISMAGYYAPRAVAFEPRVKAYIGWSGCYSVLGRSL